VLVEHRGDGGKKVGMEGGGLSFVHDKKWVRLGGLLP
jgi:hypothetical protein